MKSHLLFILFTTLAWSGSVAQENGPRSHSSLPTFVQAPMTPEASALGKFTDIPIGLSTGTVSPSVPIYTIELKELSIPISIDYHSSGVKVNDLSTSVGLGWSLNAGGMVSISVNGENDFGPVGWLANAWVIPQDPTVALRDSWVDDMNWESDNDEYRMRQMSEGLFDTQPDLFYYSYPGGNGKFIFDEQQIIRTIPFSKKMITMDQEQCVIVDERGNRFIYEEREITYTSTLDYGRPEGTPSHSNFSLYLTRIVSRYGEEVNFTYSMETYTFRNQRSETRYSFWPDQHGCSTTQPAPYYSESTTTVFRPRLVGISSDKGHKVSLEYGAVRSDVNTFALDTFKESAMLSRITVHRGGGANTTFDLYQSYFGNAAASDPDAKRLKLDSVRIAGGQVYRFSYINPAGVPHRLSYSQDHWGFYNGAGNSTLLPMDPANGFTSGANREVNDLVVRYGMLEKVAYPTGGFMEIRYESNEHFTGSINEKVGGLRVSKVIQDFGQGPPRETNYLYEEPDDPGTSSGTLLFAPAYTYTYRWEAPAEIYHERYDCFCTGQTTLPLPSLGGFTSVRYMYVTEQVATGTETGRTVTEFGGYSFAEVHYGYPFGPPIIFDWSAHNPTKVSEYRYDGTSFQPVRQTSYLYKDAFGYDELHRPNEKAIRGAKVILYLGPIKTDIGVPIRGPQYQVTYFSYFSSWYYLKETEETYFTDQGEVTSTRKYYYDNPAHGLVTREVMANISADSADSLIVLRKYPPDYHPSASTAVGLMTANHILNEPVEVLELMKTDGQHYLLGGLLTEPASFGGQPLPKNYHRVQTADPVPFSSVVYPVSGSLYQTLFPTANNLYHREAEIVSYGESGNITELQLSGAPPEAFVWGYGGRYPVARIVNATYAQVSGVLGGPTLDDLYSLDVSDAAVNSAIAALQAHPGMQQSQVSGYTHALSVGMTGTTDPGGDMAYYTYDAFNRLSSVKDYQGNIIANYRYNYAGEPSSYDGRFSNAEVSVTLARNNCPSGQVGSPVTYTVAAGTYRSWESQAAVDSMAQADLNANAQAYANTHGTCHVLTRTSFSSMYRTGLPCDTAGQVSREIWIPNAQVPYLSDVPLDESTDTGVIAYADAVTYQPAAAGLYTELYGEPSDGTKYRVYEIDHQGNLTRYFLCDYNTGPPDPSDFDITLMVTESGTQRILEVYANRSYSNSLTITGRVSLFNPIDDEIGGGSNFSIVLPAGLSYASQPIYLSPETSGPYTGEFRNLQCTPANIDGGTVSLIGTTYYPSN